MTLSLVIPTLNEEKCLPKLLESITEQTSLPDELIIVDAESTDKTRQLITNFSAIKTIIVNSSPKNSIAKARQLGSMAAKGDVIAGTDADCKLASNWVELVKKIFTENPNTVAVFGPAGLYEPMPFLKKLFLKYADDLGIFLNYYILHRPSMTGRNFAVRQEAFLKIGGFNEKLFTHEDYDLGDRLAKIGKVFFTPRLKVETSSRRAKENYKTILSRNLGNSIIFLIKHEAPKNFPAIR